MIPQTVSRFQLLAAVILAIAAGFALRALSDIGSGDSFDSYLVVAPGGTSVQQGAAVEVAGMDVGRVLAVAQSQDDRQVIRLGLRHGLGIRQGTTAVVRPPHGVALLPPAEFAPMLAPGQELPYQEAMALADGGQPAQQTQQASMPAPMPAPMPAAEPPLAPQATGPALKIARADLAGIAGGVQSDDEARSMAGLMARLPELVDSLHVILMSMDQSLKQVTADVHRAVEMQNKAMETLLPRAQRLATAGEKTMADVSRSLRQLDAVTRNLPGDLENGQERLSVLLDRTEVMIEEFTTLSREMRERPWQVLYRPQEDPRP